MASELLAKGYTDPAAVLAGSVLEEHIRSLAGRNGLSLTDGKRTKSVDTLLIDLVKAGRFSESQRKITAAWYAIRSEAAHGNYANVVAEDVGRMIDAIRDFMARYPA